MGNAIIQLEDVGKMYRLGYVGTGTLRDDLRGWWAQIRGRENPNLPVGLETSGSGTHYLWALRSVNLEINQGEILGIIGANGSGKSTMLKLLSRVTAPTAGTIRMRGRVGSLLEVGTGFHPELTGRENVFLNGSILGMPTSEIEKKFDEIVDFAGVGRYIDTPVKRYSSGMYVRLGFAVAAHLDPDILIVDEVLAVGDAEFQKKAVGKISSASQEGRTVLFVSHNMGSIREMTTRCVQLQSGEIVDEGPAEEVVERYLQKVQNTRSGGGLAQYRYPQLEKITPLEIVEISVESSDKNDGLSILPVGSPIEIKIIVQVSQKIDSPYLECHIKNSQFATVAIVHNHNLKNFSLKKGRNVITCKIPDIWFYPNNYFLSISIRPSIMPRHHWDVIQDYPVFRIANIGEYSFRELKVNASVVSLRPDWFVND